MEWLREHSLIQVRTASGQGCLICRRRGQSLRHGLRCIRLVLRSPAPQPLIRSPVLSASLHGIEAFLSTRTCSTLYLFGYVPFHEVAMLAAVSFLAHVTFMHVGTIRAAASDPAALSQEVRVCMGCERLLPVDRIFLRHNAVTRQHGRSDAKSRAI